MPCILRMIETDDWRKQGASTSVFQFKLGMEFQSNCPQHLYLLHFNQHQKVSCSIQTGFLLRNKPRLLRELKVKDPSTRVLLHFFQNLHRFFWHCYPPISGQDKHILLFLYRADYCTLGLSDKPRRTKHINLEKRPLLPETVNKPCKTGKAHAQGQT